MRSFFILIAVAVVAPASAQQSYTPPDLSGVWKRTYKINQTFDPPLSGPGPVTQDPRYPVVTSDGVPRRPLPFTEEQRKHVIQFVESWIGDVTNPILQPKTREALEKTVQQEIAGYPHPENQTRCLPSGTPSVLNLLDNLMIIQTPAEVLFLYERDHHVRHVYLNQPHSKNPGHTWWGESVGHYEGEALVVDTIGENDKTEVDRFGTTHSNQIHVVERYRRAQDGRTIEAIVNIDDPIAFTMPWSATAHYAPVKNNTFDEIACAESQHQFWPGHEISLPVATKPDF